MSNLIISLLLLCSSNMNTCNVHQGSVGTFIEILLPKEERQCLVMKDIPYQSSSYQRESRLSVVFIPCPDKVVK